MKHTFINDQGVEQPIVGVKMSAHTHPSGLRLTESEARSRHRRNDDLNRQLAEQAATVPASQRSLSRLLNHLAYETMAERGLDYGKAMQVVMVERKDLATAYRRMTAPREPDPAAAPPPMSESEDGCPH